MSSRAPIQQQPPSGMRSGAPWEQPPYMASQVFTYETDIPNTTGTVTELAAGASAQLTFNVAGDSDFFWTKFAAFALVGGAATTRDADQLPAVTILLTNTTTGRQYSNNPVPLPNMAGNGQFPFILPQVVLWQAFATIQVNLANEGNVTYSNLQLSFIGVKAFTNSNMTPG